MICSSWPAEEKAHQKRKRAGQAASNKSNDVAVTKSRVLKRISKNESVLHKHLKWLKDLQEERRLHEEKKEAERKAELERKRLFIEREARKRAAGGNLSDGPKSEHGSPIGREKDDSSLASSIASSPEATKTNRPAWCQSEEMAEMEDEANLLDFVSNLDFDAYNEDLELQSLMSQVKERIKTLEREKRKDETKLQTCVDSENAALRAKTIEKRQVVDFVPQDGDTDDEIDDDAHETASIANSVMSESSLGSVHSKRSLAALVTKARDRRSEMVPIDEEEGEQAMPPPILSTVSDDDGARMAEKKSINKLAFVNRNPAI